MISPICGILKKATNELIYKTEAGRGETGIDLYTRLCIKEITNKDLLYSTGNSTQYSVMVYMGK